MSHKYYRGESEQRLRYFDQMFLSNSSQQDLQNIKDFESFKLALKNAFGNDASLSHYADNMSDSELKKFFKRKIVQDLLDKDEEQISNTFKKLPVKVKQIKKKNISYFKATVKGKPVFARKTFIIIRGKRVLKYRDSLGRFAKRI